MNATNALGRFVRKQFSALFDSTSVPRSSLRSAIPRRIVRLVCIAALSCISARFAPAANIVWVSDANDPATGFFGTLSDQTDSGFVTLLVNAGHNVIRYNQPNAQATLLTQAEIDALNTNDLLIISRCVNSGAFQTGQGNQWNTNITKPLIDLSAFHARMSRLGWFTANEGADNTPTMLIPANTTDPVIDYLFGGVAMNGTNTALTYDEPMDRNSTPIPSAPVAGGVVYASGTYLSEAAAAPTTANFIAGWPAGTPVRGGVDILAGYRMFFSAGSRESAAAPNAIPLYTSRENLSPVGEDIFLRAVQVALRNGAAPSTNFGPAGVTSQPANLSVARGQPAAFSITVTGAAPRSLQWQRGTGGSFADIPGAVSSFAKASYALPTVDLGDSGAQFRVIVSNAVNVITSSVATLTVTPDTNAPVPLSAASFDGAVVTICFNEPVNNANMVDSSSYVVDGGSILVTSVTAAPDGRSVNLTLATPMGATATVDFFYLEDRFGNVAFSGPTLVARNFGLTGVDIGAVTPAGSNLACDTNSFQVTAGGVDIGSTADILRFVHKTVTGDFDARVRVTAFVGVPDHFETTAKALLLARVDNTAASAGVNVWITPSYPADNNVTASYRAAAGGATNTFGTTLLNNGLPNAWMRIQRVGDQFTTYRSLNGVDWVSLGTTTQALGPTLNVGVGAVSHRSGKAVTATFNNFSVQTGAVPTATTLTRSSYAGAGRFSASFQTQTGFNYAVQYKDNLNLVPWNTLTNIAGDGTLKTFSDPGPVSATGNRFYRISAQ